MVEVQEKSVHRETSPSDNVLPKNEHSMEPVEGMGNKMVTEDAEISSAKAIGSEGDSGRKVATQQQIQVDTELGVSSSYRNNVLGSKRPWFAVVGKMAVLEEIQETEQEVEEEEDEEEQEEGNKEEVNENYRKQSLVSLQAPLAKKMVTLTKSNIKAEDVLMTCSPQSNPEEPQGLVCSKNGIVVCRALRNHLREHQYFMDVLLTDPQPEPQQKKGSLRRLAAKLKADISPDLRSKLFAS